MRSAGPGSRRRPRRRAPAVRAPAAALAVALTVALAVPAASLAASFPAARGAGGAVVSPERLSTEVGLEILRRGGNAVDAAVATALAMAVVHPQAGNLGGGGFAIVRLGGEVTTLDFRETAPAAATRDLYLDAEGQPRPGASLVGPLAAGVPGTGPGLAALHQRYGTLPWREMVEPARRAAVDGFRVSRRLHEALDRHRRRIGHYAETAAVWLPEGEPPAIGATMRLPALGTTLGAYAAQGASALTSGPVAAAIEAASDRHGGILTAADLAAYRPVWRDPVRFEAFGWQLASMGLPSSGGIILGQTLGTLERLGWGTLPRFGAERAHLLAEALRRSFADRLLLGDPASSEATATELLDPAWIDHRAASIDPARATPSVSLAPWPGELGAEAAETIHLSTLDPAGGAVAMTLTLNGSFGCGLLVPEAGFLLNNEMDDFTTAPGRPNLYGLVQGEANAVSPGRRMLSSMSPTLAWRGGQIVAVGAQGGSKIPTSVLQILLALLVDDDPLQAAVDRPRLHHQWLPDRLDHELGALAPETRQALLARGHSLELDEDPGEANALRRRADGTFEAAGDPRGPDVGDVVDAW